MVTFLASPKRFDDEFGLIQDRAITSWLLTYPDVEIILFGEGIGIAEAAVRHKVRYVPEIGCTPTGVPYFDSIVSYAKQYAKYDVQIYLNCDILMPPRFLDAFGIPFQDFLLVGQRIDLAPGISFEIADDDWLEQLRRLWLAGSLKLQPVTGIDFFVFRRGLWASLQPLIIGRGGYDNALLAFCLRRRIPIIDVSYLVHAVHQHHSYAHVSGKKMEAHKGIEAKMNWDIHDIWHSRPDLGDADFVYLDGALSTRKYRGDAIRALEITLRYKFNLKYSSYVVRLVWRFLNVLRIRVPRDRTLADVLPEAKTMIESS